MQGILVIIHVVLCILNQLEGSTTQLWYETRMSEKIVPVYKQAFETLQHSILDPLLANVDQDNETAINHLFFDLTCSVQGMYHDLNFAVNESKKLYQEVDQKLVDVVAAISTKEGQVNRKQGEIQQKAAEIQGAQSELVLAERSLWDKQQSLADAENALRIAEEKVEN